MKEIKKMYLLDTEGEKELAGGSGFGTGIILELETGELIQLLNEDCLQFYSKVKSQQELKALLANIPQPMSNSTAYSPTYKLIKTDYQRLISEDAEVEYLGVFGADEHMISNPPDHKEIIEKIKKVLKGTGISKITITFLQQNL